MGSVLKENASTVSTVIPGEILGQDVAQCAWDIADKKAPRASCAVPFNARARGSGPKDLYVIAPGHGIKKHDHLDQGAQAGGEMAYIEAVSTPLALALQQRGDVIFIRNPGEATSRTLSEQALFPEAVQQAQGGQYENIFVLNIHGDIFKNSEGFIDYTVKGTSVYAASTVRKNDGRLDIGGPALNPHTMIAAQFISRALAASTGSRSRASTMDAGFLQEIEHANRRHGNTARYVPLLVEAGFITKGEDPVKVVAGIVAGLTAYEDFKNLPSSEQSKQMTTDAALAKLTRDFKLNSEPLSYDGTVAFVPPRVPFGGQGATAL